MPRLCSVRALAAAWLVPLLLGACAAPVFAADSLRTSAELGVGYDLTNEIYFEQPFDSTALTKRQLVSDPESRVFGLAETRLALHYRGQSRMLVENQAQAGTRLVRDDFRLDWRHETWNGWRAVLGSELDYRRDTSFDLLRRDFRGLGRLGLERRPDDLSSALRMLYRFDVGESRTQGGPGLYPDYRFHRLTVGYDRFDFTSADWGLEYTAGYRSFPDTSVRNYFDHLAEGRLRFHPWLSTDLEFRGSLNRRAARDTAAEGDRFWAGDLELRFERRLGDEGRWSWGVRGEFQGTGYDHPNRTFFHNVVERAGVSGRFENLPDWSATLWLEGEALRAPRNGGLGDPDAYPDALNALREEYNQGRVRLELERTGRVSFLFFDPALGRRVYRIQTRSDTDLLARSSYWFVETNSFFDTRLARLLRARLSADFLYEFHDLPQDDQSSIYVTAELRYLLGP